MGAWGTGLFDDDTTCDVRDEFLEYLEEGKTGEEATKLLLEEYLDDYEMHEDLEVISLIYIGLAATQLENNCLQENVRRTAIELIERGADLELWGEVDDEGFKERKEILHTFKEKLIAAGK